jgi:hypothetical protein
MTKAQENLCFYDQSPVASARIGVVSTTLPAVDFVRDSMQAVIGDLTEEAQNAIDAAMASAAMLTQVDGDEIETVRDLAVQLMVDVWIAGQFAGAVQPQMWPTTTLARLCVLMVATVQFGEQFPDELDETG